MRRRRKLPPWSRHHEPWCGVFRDMPCDCDDDDRRPRYRRRPLARLSSCRRLQFEIDRLLDRRGEYARMGSDDIVLSPHAPSVCPAISAACCARDRSKYPTTSSYTHVATYQWAS